MKIAKLAALALVYAFLFAQEASAVVVPPVCLQDGRGDRSPSMPNCLTAPACGDQEGNSAANAPGLRLNPNPGSPSTTPVDARGTCRYLDNSSANSYFVPFNSEKEWTAFRNNAPSGVTQTHCARPHTDSAKPYRFFFGPSSAIPAMGDTGSNEEVPVNLPYWRTGQRWPSNPGCLNAQHTYNHTCYEEYAVSNCWNSSPRTCTRCTATDGSGLCTRYENYDCSCRDWGSVCAQRTRSWTEIFGFSALAGDSDNTSIVPNWSDGIQTRLNTETRPSQCSIRCTFNGHDCSCAGVPPIIAPYSSLVPVNGVCGSANGRSLSYSPSAGEMCSSGSVGSVSGSWNWRCYGSNGGGTVACSASYFNPTCPPVEAWGNPIDNCFIDLNYVGLTWGRAYCDGGNGRSYFGGTCHRWNYPDGDGGKNLWVRCMATQWLRRNVSGYGGVGECGIPGGWYLSPVKVNIAGGNAVMNSDRETKFYLTLKDGRIMEGVGGGGLNPDEGWLMVRRSNDPLVYVKSGAVNADNWFGDRDKRAVSGYADLAETFKNMLVKDADGQRYIPLKKLSDDERKAALSASTKRIKGKREINNPSRDLRVIDAANIEYFASDFFTKIYVDARNVVEYDGKDGKPEGSKNVILARGIVQTIDGKNLESVDQWFFVDIPSDYSLTDKTKKSKIWPKEYAKE